MQINSLTYLLTYLLDWSCGMCAFSSDEWTEEYCDFDIGHEASRTLRGRGPPCDNVRHGTTGGLWS